MVTLVTRHAYERFTKYYVFVTGYRGYLYQLALGLGWGIVRSRLWRIVKFVVKVNACTYYMIATEKWTDVYTCVFEIFKKGRGGGAYKR